VCTRTVLADSLLRQLFYNLIDNSLKYGEKVTQIRICCEETSQDQLKLVYEDNGVGISSSEKPKLFAKGPTTGQGSGYGLHLAKELMNVYGWTIQEVGEPGKGVLVVRVIPKMKDDGRLQISVNSSLGETHACLQNRNTAQSSADKQGSCPHMLRHRFT
jgi:signal transduction histidine kinase